MILLAQISERLDWFGYGISSANRTAAFIACLIIATFSLFQINNKIIKIFGYGLSLVLFYFLSKTESRGALVALLVASCSFIIFSRVKFNRITFCSVLLWIVFAYIISSQGNLNKRVENMVTLQSSSANCRADIYLSGLKMLTDAPNGVKVDKSPVEIYMKWYQNPDDSEIYLSMINSHLEVICKYGIEIRLLYILGWIAILGMLFPTIRNTFDSALFSIWICFGISATFSNVMNYWVLWIVPTIALIFGIYRQRHKLNNKNFYVGSVFISLLVLSILYITSAVLTQTSNLNIKKNGDVIVGNSAKIALLFPVERSLGTHYGSELSNWSKKHNTGIFVSENPTYDNFSKIIVCGSSTIDISKFNTKSMLFLNTPIPIGNYRNKKITAIVGRFTDWRIRQEWGILANSNKNVSLIILEGVGDYIPDWTRFLK